MLIKFACFFLSLCTFCHLLFVCNAYIGHHTRGISTQVKKNRKIGVEATVNSNLSFLVAEIFVFLNYSKIVLLRQENIRIMLAVLLLEKGQKLCSIPQIMPKIMLAQSARA